MDVIEDVAAFLASEGDLSVDDGVKLLDEKYTKYKYIEGSMTSQKARLLEKLPEFKNSLMLLDLLIAHKEKGEPLETTHLLSDEVYARAIVDNPEKVSLWLGANVMVEYELEEAKAFIRANQANINETLAELTEELSFVKDQITTTEVNIAHVYNYGVKLRSDSGAKS